jgi:hypothetical protein
MSQTSLPIEPKGSALIATTNPTHEVCAMTTVSHTVPVLSADDTATLIARLTASYGRPVAVAPAANVKPQSKLAAIKAAQAAMSDKVEDGSQAAPVIRQLITTAPLPTAGTLSAKDYIIASRRATSRDDRIKAIAGYMGFDSRGDFASQELQATMKAQQELRGTVRPLARPVHSGSVSVAGFIAGMPDHAAKNKANLEARERAAIDAGLETAKAADYATSEADRVMYAGMAQVERERLTQIQADLAAL